MKNIKLFLSSPFYRDRIIWLYILLPLKSLIRKINFSLWVIKFDIERSINHKIKIHNIKKAAVI